MADRFLATARASAFCGALPSTSTAPTPAGGFLTMAAPSGLIDPLSVSPASATQHDHVRVSQCATDENQWWAATLLVEFAVISGDGSVAEVSPRA